MPGKRWVMRASSPRWKPAASSPTLTHWMKRAPGWAMHVGRLRAARPIGALFRATSAPLPDATRRHEATSGGLALSRSVVRARRRGFALADGGGNGSRHLEFVQIGQRAAARASDEESAGVGIVAAVG